MYIWLYFIEWPRLPDLYLCIFCYCNLLFCVKMMQVLDVTFSIYQVYMYYNKYWCIINFQFSLRYELCRWKNPQELHKRDKYMHLCCYLEIRINCVHYGICYLQEIVFIFFFLGFTDFRVEVQQLWSQTDLAPGSWSNLALKVLRSSASKYFFNHKNIIYPLNFIPVNEIT